MKWCRRYHDSWIEYLNQVAVLIGYRVNTKESQLEVKRKIRRREDRRRTEI